MLYLTNYKNYRKQTKMKKVLLLSVLISLASLVSCKEYTHTIEITFINGDKDTLNVTTINDEPEFENGDIKIMGYSNAVVSGVRSYKILNTITKNK